MKNQAVARRALKIALLVLLIPWLALGLLVLLLGPLINSDGVRLLAEQTLSRSTGWTFRIEELRFRYPFSISLRGFSLFGDLETVGFLVHVRSARLESGFPGLLQGRADRILVEGVEANLRFPTGRNGQGASGRMELPGWPAFRPPAWLWRIRQAEVHSTAVRLNRASGSLRLDNLAASWSTGDAAPASGTLRLRLGNPGQGGPSASLARPRDKEERDAATRLPDEENELVFRLDSEQLSPGSGSWLLPALDLPSVLALADLDLPVRGSVTARLSLLPASEQAVGIDLRAASGNLSLQDTGAGFGLANAEVAAAVLVFLPRKPQDIREEQESGPAGTAPVSEAILPAQPAAPGMELQANLSLAVSGIQVRGKPLDPAFQPLEAKVLCSLATAADLAKWTAEAWNPGHSVRISTSGTLEGLLAGSPRTEARSSFTCKDLGVPAAALSPWLDVPAGVRLRGALEAEAELRGELQDAGFQGRISSSRAEVRAQGKEVLPVEVAVSFQGSLKQARLARLSARADALRVGGMAVRELELDLLGGHFLQGRIRAVKVPVRSLASALKPLLPSRARDLEWGGEFDFSARGSAAIPALDRFQGDFSLALRDGQFNSPDFQRMAEKMDLRIRARLDQRGRNLPVRISLEAAVDQGELVYGSLYGNFTANRPRLAAELGVARNASRIDLQTAELTLEGVGTLLCGGRFSGSGADRRLEGRAELQNVNLERLFSQVLRDGLGGSVPVFARIGGSGTLNLNADFLDSRGGRAIRGHLGLANASFDYPPGGLAARGVFCELPFSLGNQETLSALLRGAPGEVANGRVRPEEILVKGLSLRSVDLRLMVQEDALQLLQPLEAELAGGRVLIREFGLQGILGGNRRGQATLEISDLDFAELSTALLGKSVGGRLDVLLEQARYEESGWALKGGLWLRAGGGFLALESLEARDLPPEGLGARCRLIANQVPLEVLSAGMLENPLEGLLQGDLGLVELASGKLTTQGFVCMNTMGGSVRISGIRAGGLGGRNPWVQTDLSLRGIDLYTLTSPLHLGSVSGILEGRIEGIKVTGAFPYVKAFRADLGTVKRRGVRQRIDATAVQTLSKVGGSNALTAALSGSLFRFFDQYYYGRMGFRASLEKGWLEIHGIPRGNEEYLIVRANRLPTISMPIRFLSPGRKIRFAPWLRDLLSLGSDK